MNRLAQYTGDKEDLAPRAYGSVDWSRAPDIIAFADERWASRPRRLGPMEKQWHINVSFFLGKQWIAWDNVARAVRQTPAPRWRVRLTINLVQGVARKIVSKILSARPQWAVAPATSDYEDVERSRVGEAVARGYWAGKLRMDSKLWDALNWMSVCGTGGLRLYWDTEAGDVEEISLSDVEDPKDRKRLAKRKKAKGGTVELNAGDAAVEVLPPFAMDPDPAATGPDDMTHIIHSRVRTKAWVEEHYPEAADKVRFGVDQNGTFYERRLSGLAGPETWSSLSTQSGDDSIDEDSVVVHDIWGLPTPGAKSGVHAVVAGGALLANEKNPFRYDGQVALPFAIFREIVVPGRFWGTCALEQAIGLQSNLNAARSQLVENRNLMTRPKWFVPRGANIGDNALTSEPGEIVEHTPGLRPEPAVLPPLPGYVIRELEATRGDFQDVTNLHEVSNAQTPGGVSSGVAIAQLQEQDSSVLMPTVQSIEDQLGRMGGMLLHLLSRNVDEERLVKLVGEETPTRFQAFTGEGLVGKRKGVNYFDVRVQMGSQLGLSKESQRNTLLQLAQVFPDLFQSEDAQRKLLDMVNVGSADPLYNDARLDISNALTENDEMMDGKIMAVHTSDHDELHLAEHERFQKTPAYRQKVAKSPRVDESFEAHKALHRQQMQEKAGPAGGAPPAAAVPGPEADPVLSTGLPPGAALPDLPVPPPGAGVSPEDLAAVPVDALAPPPADISEALIRDLGGEV